MDDILNSIIALLPRNPEEGSDASRVTEQVIQDVLIQQYGASLTNRIQATLELVNNLLTKLSLLDLDEMQNGSWKFVSFPAQLCALSVLHTLADPRQRLFPSGFWHTAGVSEDVKKEQKSVLKALEDRRHAFHLDAGHRPHRSASSMSPGES